jgi:23S rRNA pseudouridine1911/1915/1917 synthase
MPQSHNLDVLYEDNHLLAVNKPAQLATMGVKDDVPSLLRLAKDYVRTKYQKPGNVYLGVVSRLDVPVSGVVLLARTSKAAGRLSQQFREREVEKIYWAVVEGIVDPPEGQRADFLRKDERHRKVHVTSPNTPDAQEARLSYRTLETHRDLTLLEVTLETGRKHQIRVQLAKHGHPILGDRKYGSVRPFGLGITLHARRLVVAHPVGGRPIEFEAPLPKAWSTLPLSSLSR